MLVQKSERIKDKHNVNDIVYNVFINSFWMYQNILSVSQSQILTDKLDQEV